MKKLQKILSYVLVAALASAVTFGICTRTFTPAVAKLAQLEGLLEEKFIGGTGDTVLTDVAADAMVQALGDRWSYYMSPSDYQVYLEQMSNSYVGVGITIQVMEDDSGFRIVQVTAGGPAEEVGLLPGDVVVGVSGEDVAGWTTAQVRDLVKGKEGTFVDMTVVREGQELTIPVERRSIQTPVASSVMLENNVGLVAIYNFDSRCADETIAAIEAVLDQGAKALVFDVRFNPGGYAHELVKVLDYLLPEGELFRKVDYAGNEEVDRSDARCLEMPMAVLVNSESYSAAEFFAAALREYEYAVVVGEQTVGKGYFQRSYQLVDGSAVGLSVGKYFTPKGVSLSEAGGITPDIPVAVTEEEAFAIYSGTLNPEQDPQIQAAVAALLG